MSSGNTFQSIAEYKKACTEEAQLIVDKLCNTIKEVAPNAEETISYGMPTYNINGKYLVYFAVWKNHIGFYPFPNGDEALERELERYKAAKGTLRFPLNQSIPYDLIRKVVLHHLNHR